MICVCTSGDVASFGIGVRDVRRLPQAIRPNAPLHRRSQERAAVNRDALLLRSVQARVLDGRPAALTGFTPPAKADVWHRGPARGRRVGKQQGAARRSGSGGGRDYTLLQRTKYGNHSSDGWSSYDDVNRVASHTWGTGPDDHQAIWAIWVWTTYPPPPLKNVYAGRLAPP